MRTRVTVWCGVILAVACSACGGGVSRQEPPPAHVVVGDVALTSVRASYCWSRAGHTRCVHTLGPMALLEQVGDRPPLVTPQASARIAFDAPPLPDTVQVEEMTTTRTYAVPLGRGGVLALPEMPGLYVYLVHARWKQGDASYAFWVQVV